MKFTLPSTGSVTTVLKAIPEAIDALVGLLPPKWATKVRSARKAIVSGAGAVSTALVALSVIPLPPNITPYVVLAGAICTAIATYWVPNEGS